MLRVSAMKMKMKEKAMTKFTAACLAVLMLATWFTVGCSMGFHVRKDTGPVTVQKYTNHSAYQLLRPDGELIVMEMYNEGAPDLDIGDSFSNIEYYDQNDHQRIFVKGEGFKPAPEVVKSEATTGRDGFDNSLSVDQSAVYPTIPTAPAATTWGKVGGNSYYCDTTGECHIFNSKKKEH